MIIDINRLIDETLNINECLFIYFCQTKDIKNYNFYREQFGSIITREGVVNLIDRGYLEFVDISDQKFVFSNLNPTNKCRFILGEVEKQSVVIQPEFKRIEFDWMEDWYALFPKGIKSGSYPVRSGLNTCRAKMLKFLKRNKFNKETIILATKLYIKEMEKVNYSYMQLAKYFIEKDGSSTLESYCEQILDKIASGEDINIELNKGYSDGFNTSLN